MICLVLATSLAMATQSSAYAKGLYFVFPDAGSARDKIAFCVTAQEANQLAMDNAANMIEHLGSRKSQPAPDVIVEKIGGYAAYRLAQADAEQRKPNIYSLSQTYYYPLMSGDSSPYTVSEGQTLLSAQMRCLDVFEQAMNEQ